MGKLIDKIKELLFGKKMKMLPPGEEETINYRKNHMQEFKEGLSNYEEVKQAPQVNNPYLEYALAEYFNEYLKQIRDFPATGIIPNSYDVLTSINATKGDANKNAYYENNLLSRIRQQGRYSITEQTIKKTGECAFYHIKSRNHKMPDFKDMIRIYINCRDENVANLAQQLLHNNQNPNYYLKFDSTSSMNKRSRSEKIVVYTDEAHLGEDIQNIMNVKQMYPQLFVDSDKMNPFMQQYENTIALARQPVTGNYVDQNGLKKTISQSSNTFISQILQDSYTQTVRDIASKNSELGFLLEEGNINNYNLYIQNYPYINSKYHDDFLNNMEGNMFILSNNNNVFINGISNKITEQNRTDNSDGEHSL